MKKCALFLMCCLFLASCSKNPEVTAPAFNPDRDLEIQIEKDLSLVKASMLNYFEGLDQQQIVKVKEQLDNGIEPAVLAPLFAANSFLSAQSRLADHLRSLSYREDHDRFEAFVESIAGQKSTLVKRAYSTPCYDAWDIQTAGITATYLLCLSYAVEPISISACTTGAVVAYAFAEITYQNCMEQYE